MSLGHRDSLDPLGQIGIVLDHRFRLERTLGSGSVHLVFAASDLLEERQVCVKLPKKPLRTNTGFTMRYRRDVLELILQPHPGWVTPQRP